MSDQWIAVLVGGGVMIALRIVDFFMPKGWVSNWTKSHAKRSEAEDERDDDGDPVDA